MRNAECGVSTLDFGPWTLDFGPWTLDFGLLERLRNGKSWMGALPIGVKLRSFPLLYA